MSSVGNLVARSVRYKLLALALIPILLFVPIVVGLAIYWSQQFSQDQLLRKVRTDLSVAHDGFARIQRDYLASLKYLAESHVFRTSFKRGNAGELSNQLHVLRVTARFDFLHITDLQGRWLFESPSSQAGSSKPSPLLEKAGRVGIPGVGVEIYSPDDLRREHPALVEKVRLSLLDTPRAAPTAREAEDRAMVIRAVYPVRNERGAVIALLDGGVLLNRNFSFVDAIRDLVYGPGSVSEDGWGAVTIFLDDVRITTNVPYEHNKGERALGTRVSREVRAKVLEAGETWVDRAFVVNDWYISAYEPIWDVNGERVGMLYAGYVEAPFRSAYYQKLSVLVGLLMLGLVFAVILAIRGAKSIFEPMEAMAQVVRAQQAGEHRRIGRVQSRDEIGELARQFDAMLDLLDERNQEIRRAAEQLEHKVEERTRELREKNVRLQKTIDLLRETRRQLVTAEKLAAVGELTAGVAHEINNPTAVILGNVEILVKELGADIEPVKTEIDLIIAQVYRIRAIVDKLLQYSRPADYGGYVEDLDVNAVIEDTLVLVKHEIVRKNAHIETDYAARTRVGMNRQELQQVLVNLIVNALHAISAGGIVELRTREWNGQGIVMSIADDGEGIAEKQLERIFDPFFTTKKRQGTGLGLSVSYGLIRRYGGRITVVSELGKGTRFDVFLRQEPVFTEDDEELMKRYLDAS